MHIETLQERMARREARMGTAIVDAQAIGHTQTISGTTVTCACGHTATTAPFAQKVAADMHARETLGALTVTTTGR